MGDVATEEQPSRILFVRGLDATVSDEALVHMFEVHTKHLVSSSTLCILTNQQMLHALAIPLLTVIKACDLECLHAQSPVQNTVCLS